jgi:hypothetical protein
MCDKGEPSTSSDVKKEVDVMMTGLADRSGDEKPAKLRTW